MNGSKHTPLSPDELSVFCYQLSLMVQAGIGSEASVGILADDARNPREQALLRQIHKVLMEGESLSKALESTGVFPNYLLRMVEIGQISGRLEQVLSALSTFYRRESALRQSLRRAVAYPAAMAVLIAVVFLALVSQVLPVFEQVFRQLGVSMSPVARGLMAFGDVSKYVAAVFAVVLILAAGYLLWLFRSQKGQAAMSRLLSHTGPSQAVDRSRFSAAMALMLSSGLPLDEALSRSRALMEDTGPLSRPGRLPEENGRRDALLQGHRGVRHLYRAAVGPAQRRIPHRLFRAGHGGALPAAVRRRPTNAWRLCWAGLSTPWWWCSAWRWGWCSCR